MQQQSMVQQKSLIYSITTSARANSDTESFDVELRYLSDRYFRYWNVEHAAYISFRGYIHLGPQHCPLLHSRGYLCPSVF
jgi:hypothetical protein